ncbi:MAG: glycosyl hydrolase [Limisphaerales bacterium]
MNSSRRGFGFVFLLFVTLMLPATSRPAWAATSAEVKAVFANPPREYASAPLWTWNDMLTEQQIRETMRDLAGQRVRQVFVHPRPGLMTPYLSPDWFRLWKVALDEAEKLDMNVWIYDENSYPSGFAGGWVPELMPEARGMGLHLKESKIAPKWSDDLVAVNRVDADRTENVTARVKAGDTLPEGRYVVASIQRAGNSPWHGNRSYVNLLTPGVTEKFIEVTLEAYRREVGDEFGKRVPGVFTDEPNIRPAGGFPWCPDLPEQFQKRWGYDLLAHLPGLTLEVGDWRRVRHNYFCLLTELFIERWGKPVYEWCERNNLEFTGHYWDHEWPHCVGVPDNMAMAAWQQRPGVDTLMNQYAENTHAQFGNVRYCREVSSLANQLGRKRTLVELYGAGGWDLRFEDMKRIADWLQVLGINTMDEHVSYVTIRGARKRDHPQSFSYHEPWWEAYHTHASYMTRLSAALTQGEQINRVLVIEPTTTAWMYQGNEAKLREIGDSFFKVLMALEAAQIEYDLGCEDVITRHGSVSGKELVIGQRSYPVVVLPPFTENLNAVPARLIEEFAKAGGKRVSLGATLQRVDGKVGTASGSDGPEWAALAERLPAIIRKEIHSPLLGNGVSIDRQTGDPGILFHMRRELDDGQILFLVNTSIQSPSRGTVSSTLKGVEQWDLHTGQVRAYPFRENELGLEASFELPPSGSLMLFLSKTPLKPAPPLDEAFATVAAKGPIETRRVEPNVLTLDYVDVTAGGETRPHQYFYAANQFVWQKNGMDRNPWDSAVQFKDELIRKTFPADSGFTASYRFAIEGAVPSNLSIVIERPDLYSITCNDQPVAARKGAWWLDKAFGRIEIAKAARAGDNVVTITAKPFTMFHELESAYVLGDFSLKPVERGFVIVPETPLRLSAGDGVLTHGSNPDGTSWLSGGIGFEGGKDDRAPFIVFDLGQTVDLSAARVWNYNEAHVRDLTARGAKDLQVEVSETRADGAWRVVGSMVVKKGNGRAALPQELPLPERARYVRLRILSNHAGVTYPAAGQPDDNGFVGLGEVQFLAADGRLVSGVTVVEASSELAGHGRQARHLVDGSGLAAKAGLGWNDQGHPFYAAGVGYEQTFTVDPKAGRCVVTLPKWYGSVAQVLVNGDPAGYIAAPPWELDVTGRLIKGENRVEVLAIGTLKNTLGPHHGGHALGSAWPGMFQNGPKNGPPPGTQYSTVAYGLFEPFVLKQASQSAP